MGATAKPMNTAGSWFDRAWRWLLLGTMTLFVVNIGLIIAAVSLIGAACAYGSQTRYGAATNGVAASIPKRGAGFRSASGTRGDGRGELPLP